MSGSSKRKKLYLSKAVEADPNVCQKVKQLLTQLDLDIVEFRGGTYSNRELLECDYLLIIPPLQAKGDNIDEDGDECDYLYKIAKGQYSQITEFKSLKKDNDSIFIVSTNWGAFNDGLYNQNIISVDGFDSISILDSKIFTKGYAILETGNEGMDIRNWGIEKIKDSFYDTENPVAITSKQLQTASLPKSLGTRSTIMLAASLYLAKR